MTQASLPFNPDHGEAFPLTGKIAGIPACLRCF